MNHQHLTDEELILHYYGEEGAAPDGARRIEECGECRALYGSLQRTLNAVDALPVPERGADYGERVWRSVEARAGGLRRPRFSWFPWRWAAAGVALAGLLAAAFLAGRNYPARQVTAARGADPRASEQVLLVAVGDYLDRSQMVLVELANADPKFDLDISAEQKRAHGLVTETRLYRQTAERTGNAAIAGVLDQLERVLVEITHEPSQLSPDELESLRQRLKDQSILFKIRVLGATVRREQQPAAPASPRTL